MLTMIRLASSSPYSNPLATRVPGAAEGSGKSHFVAGAVVVRRIFPKLVQ
jgi:hypothetical protein